MKKGFTLIELLISISIIALISIISTSVYRAALRTYPQSFEKAKNQSDLNFVSDSLAEQTKKAVNTLQSYGTYNRNSNTDKTILILQLPTQNNSNPPEFVYSGAILEKDTVVYYLSGGSIIKRYYGNSLGQKAAQTGVDQTILKNVTGFNCDYSNIVSSQYSTVSCTITTAKNILGKNIILTSTKIANLRNMQ